MSNQRDPLPNPPAWDSSNLSTIDFTTVSEEDLTNYVKWCVLAYEYEEWCDSDLWNLYQEQFKKFTEEAWNRTNKHHVARLKKYLQTHGVYVETSRAVRMATSLYNAAHEEEQATWPPDELKKQIEAGNFHSILARSASTQAYTTTAAPIPTHLATPASTIPASFATSATPGLFATSALSQAAPVTLIELSQKVANLVKLYTEEQKYSRENDNFQHKLNIFNNACK